MKFEQGSNTYHGRACKTCGNTERYIGSSACVACGIVSYNNNKQYYKTNAQRWKANNPHKVKWKQLRDSACKRDIPFELTVADVEMLFVNSPKYCPVLNIPLEYNKVKRCDNSPSVERIDNQKGYVKENVCIISWRANRLKNDASKEELEAIIRWMSS